MSCATCGPTINQACPSYPDAGCVVYSGASLNPLGIATNDRLDTVIVKINTYLSSLPSSGGSQVQADWNQTDSSLPNYIRNKPFVPPAQVNSDWNSTSGISQVLNKPVILEIGFRVGDPGYLAFNASSFTLKDCNNNPVTGRKLDLFRQGELLTENDPIDGYTYNASTGLVTLIIAATYVRERFLIKAHPLASYQVCIYIPATTTTTSSTSTTTSTQAGNFRITTDGNIRSTTDGNARIIS